MHVVVFALSVVIALLSVWVASLRRQVRAARARPAEDARLAGLATLVPAIWGSLRAIDHDLRALQAAVLVPTPRCDRLHVADLTAPRGEQPLGDEPLCVEDLPPFRGPIRPHRDEDESNPVLR